MWPDERKVVDFKEIEDIFRDPIPSAFEGLRDTLQPGVPIRKYVVKNSEMSWESLKLS